MKNLVAYLRVGGLGLSSLCVATLLGQSSAVSAATPANTVANEQKAIAAAQTKLQADQKAIADAQKEAQTAIQNLTQVRANAYQAIAAKLGLPKVQGDLNGSRAEADRLSKELTKAAKDSPEYQQAVKDADVAREKLNAVREDKALSDEDRRKQSEELSKILRGPTDIIKARVDGDTALQEARKNMNAAQAELTTLQRQAAAELAKDASVTEAATAAKTAQDKVLAANTALQQQQQAIAAEQNKLAQTQQQQQQRATARPMAKKK